MLVSHNTNREALKKCVKKNITVQCFKCRNIKELFDWKGYPGNGGSSGIVFKNLSNPILKAFNEFTTVSLPGSVFQSFAEIIGKLASYTVKTLPLIFERGLIIAFMAPAL